MENSLSLASMLRCLMHILVNADPMSLVPPVEKIKHNKKLFMKKSSSSYLSVPQNSTNVHNTQQYTISSNHVLNIKALLYSASTTTKMLKSVQRQLMLLIKALCAWRLSFLLWKRKKNKLSVIFFYLKKKNICKQLLETVGICRRQSSVTNCTISGSGNVMGNRSRKPGRGKMCCRHMSVLLSRLSVCPPEGLRMSH